jgi:hypothetical protein
MAQRQFLVGNQAVLAFVDGDRAELAGTIEKIARWDDEGRTPYPLPRFDFAVNRVLDTVNTLLDLMESHERVGGVDNTALATGRGSSSSSTPRRSTRNWRRAISHRCRAGRRR